MALNENIYVEIVLFMSILTCCCTKYSLTWISRSLWLWLFCKPFNCTLCVCVCIAKHTIGIVNVWQYFTQIMHPPHTHTLAASLPCDSFVAFDISRIQKSPLFFATTQTHKCTQKVAAFCFPFLIVNHFMFVFASTHTTFIDVKLPSARCFSREEITFVACWLHFGTTQATVTMKISFWIGFRFHFNINTMMAQLMFFFAFFNFVGSSFFFGANALFFATMHCVCLCQQNVP